LKNLQISNIVGAVKNIRIQVCKAVVLKNPVW
jgi:hypothetical protein